MKKKNPRCPTIVRLSQYNVPQLAPNSSHPPLHQTCLALYYDPYQEHLHSWIRYATLYVSKETFLKATAIRWAGEAMLTGVPREGGGNAW